MFKVKLSRKWFVGLVGAGALALVAGGVAYATIPSNNVIDACYTRSGGTLRVIDATVTNCKASETSLAWNVQGVQGAGSFGSTTLDCNAGDIALAWGFDTNIAQNADVIRAERVDADTWGYTIANVSDSNATVGLSVTCADPTP